MEFFNPNPNFKRTNERAIDFSQSTLILPIVSLANVSQLAADLLVHSLALESVGSLSARYHVPCLSPIDYVDQVGSPSSSIPASRPRKGFSTAIEVFQSKDATLTLIQQRSPVIKSRKDAFVKSLVGFIQQAKFKRVLLLAGMDAGLFQDYDNPSPFRFVSSETSSLHTQLSQVMAPFSLSTSSLSSAASTSTATQSVPRFIPSSGLTRRLLSSLVTNLTAADVSTILMQVSEGDNRYDAHVFARCVDRVLRLQTAEEAWREPVSWKVGLYGREMRGNDASGGAGVAELYG